MTSLEPFGGRLSPRDARTLDRTVSATRTRTNCGLAILNGAGQLHDEILTITTELTRHAMVDTVQVAQMEAAGAQLVPHAAGRLSFLADQHALRASSILDRAHRDLGRLA